MSTGLIKLIYRLLLLILILVFGTVLYFMVSEIFSANFLKFYNPYENYKHVPKSREHTEISYSSSSLPQWDFNRLINMDGFKFLLTNYVCDENKQLDLLVVISSAPKNIDRRNAIRETWGSKRDNMKVLFMLGFVEDQQQQDDFDAEDRKYHDLVQGNFKDDYKNMTYKFIMAFKYVVYFCPNVKYVLKTDDDLFVNMPVFMDFIQHFGKEKDLMFCHIMDGSPAIREPSRWHVSFDEFPHSAYPIYCSGYAILFTYDVVFRLYREGQRGEYFWVDDAHVTGTLAKRINLKHTDYPDVHMTWEELPVFLESNGTKGREAFFFGPVNIGAENIRKMWTALMQRQSKLSPHVDKIIVK